MMRVRLGAMEPEDLDFLYRIENDTQLWDVGPTNVPYSRFLLHEYMSNVTGDIYTDHQARLMIENDSGEVVGIADLVNFDAKHRRAEVGIVIEKAYRNQGYATSAVLQLKDYARQVIHLHQFYAYVAEENVASLRLFTKVGFVQNAKLSDWLYDGNSYHGAWLLQCFLK